MRWEATIGAGVVAVALTGCPGPDDDRPDAGADGGNTGLVVTWSSQPEIPGTVKDLLTVTRAVFWIEDLRVVSDAGTLALATAATVAWEDDRTPAPIEIADPPAALYSRLLLELDRGAGPSAYELEGTVDGIPYLIRDPEPLALSDEFRRPLPPRLALEVEIRVGELVDDLEFDEVPLVAGRHVLEAGDPQLASVRARLAEAFRIRD